MRVTSIVLSIFCLFLFSSINEAKATPTSTTGPTTISLWTQGGTSTTHLVQSSAALAGSCGNYVYIDKANDKELYATTLALTMQPKTVYIAYEQNVTGSVNPPHGTVYCRLLSIYFQ